MDGKAIAMTFSAVSKVTYVVAVRIKGQFVWRLGRHRDIADHCNRQHSQPSDFTTQKAMANWEWQEQGLKNDIRRKHPSRVEHEPISWKAIMRGNYICVILDNVATQSTVGPGDVTSSGCYDTTKLGSSTCVYHFHRCPLAETTHESLVISYTS